MAYFINIFSPETFEAFSKSKRIISGFLERQESAATKVKRGDKLICYLTKLSRWFGVLEVKSDYFRDNTPIFYAADDPFVIRFKVKATILLPKENAIPITEKKVWDKLSFTKEFDPHTSYWTSKLRFSLNSINEDDGHFLEELMSEQLTKPQVYWVDEDKYKKMLSRKPRVYRFLR